MKKDKVNNLEGSTKKKKRLKFKITITCLTVFAILLCVGLYWSNNQLSKMVRTEIDDTDLGISKEVTEKMQTSEINDIVNIALFGVDESEDDVGRSDAMMIATFDPIHKKLKITSVMRDTCMDIPDGWGLDKANHAFAYGGAQLAIKNLNQNFGLNITDYVKVNFENLEGLVDAVGGIDMRLRDVEINEVNKYIERMSRIQTVTSDPLVKNDQGRVHLDGFQALGYTRVRDFGRGDFDRTERQRKIVTEMFNKIAAAGTVKLASMATKLMPYVETSLTNKEIINLGANVLSVGSSTIEQERFPRDGYWTDGTTPNTGLSCLNYDEEYTAKQISEYIFNDKRLWLEGNEPIPNFNNQNSYVVPNTDTNNQGEEVQSPSIDEETIVEQPEIQGGAEDEENPVGTEGTEPPPENTGGVVAPAKPANPTVPVKP